MELQLLIKSASGTADAAKLVRQIDWAGDKDNCARTLSFGLLSSAVDQNVPLVQCPLGAAVTYAVDGTVKFVGYVISREKATGDSIIDVTCADRGLYLKRNEGVYKFTNTAPEDIARRVCADFGIETGDIVSTGVKISRNFLGVALYGIIQTAYTLASETTGEAYQIRFDGENLCVIKKAEEAATVILDGKSNLMSASTTESIENMVNSVAIYDDNDKLIQTEKDDVLIAAYGRMQSYLKKSEKDDMTKKAKKTLRDNGVDQKITVENFGDLRCITGNAVIVREPYTGLDGLFWIDGDTHTWKNGQYYNKLTLNFRKLMDEQSSGSEATK